MNKMNPQVSNTLTTKVENFAVRIPDDMFRVITPLESWRLMGFDDEDYHKAAAVCTERELYHQAGNSIVVDVLMAIFRELFVEHPTQTQPQWLNDLLRKIKKEKQNV